MIYKGIAAIADEKGGFTEDDIKILFAYSRCKPVLIDYSNSRFAGNIIGAEITGKFLNVLIDAYTDQDLSMLKIVPGYKYNDKDNTVESLICFGLCPVVDDKRLTPIERVF
jgi:hypothetical protein